MNVFHKVTVQNGSNHDVVSHYKTPHSYVHLPQYYLMMQHGRKTKFLDEMNGLDVLDDGATRETLERFR